MLAPFGRQKINGIYNQNKAGISNNKNDACLEKRGAKLFRRGIFGAAFEAVPDNDRAIKTGTVAVLRILLSNHFMALSSLYCHLSLLIWQREYQSVEAATQSIDSLFLKLPNQNGNA
jgi:hypothetical protein